MKSARASWRMTTAVVFLEPVGSLNSKGGPFVVMAMGLE